MSEAKFTVDRVAEAIARVAVTQKTPDFHLQALAAIEAMREPTQEMLERGLMAGTNLTTSGPSYRLGVRNAGDRMADQWRGMVDEAIGKVDA